MENYITIFPMKLKTLRIAYELSFFEMADLLGLKNRSIPYAWENNTNFPLLDNLVNISACFGVSIDWLIGLSNEPYIETTVRESEIYCEQVMKDINKQITDYGYLSMWNDLISQQFPQYVKLETRQQYYSLAVRANISVLMQLVKLPSMYWQLYYHKNGLNS